MLCANRGYCQLRHSRDDRSEAFCNTTAGWYWTCFHVVVPVDFYRAAQARDAVDQVFEDAGIDWPATSPSSKS